MKKRIIIGIIIMILLLSYAVSGNCVINKKLSDLVNIVNAAYKDICNESLPNEECLKLKEEWQNSRQILYVFLNHKSVVELEDSIESIEKLADEGMSVNLKVTLIQTINQINDLKRSVGISIENIL